MKATHPIYTEISEARFGETNTQARHAKRDKQAHDDVYRDYNNLVTRKLGGTKPQNISQLNSKRGGVNYLLASLPPARNQEHPRSFFGIDSIFSRFSRYEDVPSLIRALRQLLKSDPDPTMETRIQREHIEHALENSLAAFGLEIQQRLQPGWTRDAGCKLPLYEQLWLDPKRAQLPPREDHEEEDIAFAQAFEWKDWPDEVASHFARELNDILRKDKLPVGDIELEHWLNKPSLKSRTGQPPCNAMLFYRNPPGSRHMAECPYFERLLVIPRLRIQNANAISSPLTHGFLAMSTSNQASMCYEISFLLDCRIGSSEMRAGFEAA